MFHKLLVVWPMHLLGCITLVLLYIYLVLLFLFSSRKEKLAGSDCQISADGMPVMRPLPIPTKSHSGLDQILAFIFLVRRWRIEQTFSFTFKGTEYLIPAGFEFDGASIPRPLWALLSPTGLLLIPGLIHDYGYRYNGIYVRNGNGNIELAHVGEQQAFWDDLFAEIGDQVNGIALLNCLAKLGLALGGGSTWRSWRDRGLSPPPFEQDTVAKESVKPAPKQPSETVKTSSDITAPEPDTKELVSGKTKTTQIGYGNKNNQTVNGTDGTEDSDSGQLVYHLACGECGFEYRTLAKEIQHRKCPECQGGKPSIVN